MKKKKKDNRPIFYVILGFLIIFLLLPPALRWFGKNLYVKEVTNKDEIIILSCNKQNEAISSTFLNKEPQNMEYLIKGDYSVKVDEEGNQITQGSSTSKNALVDIIKPYAKIEYNRSENRTSFKVKTIDLSEYRDYVVLFSSIENQQSYYLSQAFYCETFIY